MIRLLTAFAAALALGFGLAPGAARAQDLGALLETHRAAIESGSRREVGPAIDAIAASGAPRAQEFSVRLRRYDQSLVGTALALLPF